MKRTILLIIVFFMLLHFKLSACLMHYEPEKFNLELNKETILTIYIELEHRKCPIPLEDTTYSSKGINVLKKGEWEKVRRNLYKQEITVKAVNGDGTLRIWRDCEEKGISEACMNCSGCILKK